MRRILHLRILQLGVLVAFVALAAPDGPSATPLGTPTGMPSGVGRGPDATTTAPLGSPGCRPKCSGRTCGGDGCGGFCGACGKGRYCLRDRCVKGSNNPCTRLAGRWKGAMLITPVHRMDGRVNGSGKVCKARFRISFYSGGRLEWVVQDFDVIFLGTTVRFRGRRIVSNGSGTVYSLDTITGRLNAGRTRFDGTLRDTRSVTGQVVLRRK